MAQKTIFKSGLIDSKLVCGKVKAKPIYIEKDLWEGLIEAIDKDEWGIYLFYEEDEDCIKVTGYKVPKQVAGAASFEILEPENGNVGIIHSHPEMHASFSGVDDEHINSNNHFSIVINNNGKYEAVVRTQTLCGESIVIETTVLLEGEDNKYVDLLAKEIKEKREVEAYSFGKNKYGYPYENYWEKKRKGFCPDEEVNIIGNAGATLDVTLNFEMISTDPLEIHGDEKLVACPDCGCKKYIVEKDKKGELTKLVCKNCSRARFLFEVKGEGDVCELCDGKLFSFFNGLNEPYPYFAICFSCLEEEFWSAVLDKQNQGVIEEIS